MGITDRGVEFLLSAKRGGVAFERTMTIGRQFLLVPPDRRGALLSGIPARERGPALTALFGDRRTFADPLLRHLGAHEVCSIDASDHEGATFIHDMNTPVPSMFSEHFSVVLDGGCLEHIFDLPTAIRSCMQMVEVGGHFLSMAPVNNAAGHGFFQFSPELYFRVLSPENGFELERMLLAEVRPGAKWYAVTDPALAGRRIEFTTRHEAYLYVQARRIDARPPLAVAPVQSDYQSTWRKEPVKEVEPKTPSLGPVQRSLPATAAREGLRRAARRFPTVQASSRRVHREAARYRNWRCPYDPAFFEFLGEHL